MFFILFVNGSLLVVMKSILTNDYIPGLSTKQYGSISLLYELCFGEHSEESVCVDAASMYFNSLSINCNLVTLTNLAEWDACKSLYCDKFLKFIERSAATPGPIQQLYNHLYYLHYTHGIDRLVSYNFLNPNWNLNKNHLHPPKELTLKLSNLQEMLTLSRVLKDDTYNALFANEYTDLLLFICNVKHSDGNYMQRNLCVNELKKDAISIISTIHNSIALKKYLPQNENLKTHFQSLNPQFKSNLKILYNDISQPTYLDRVDVIVSPVFFQERLVDPKNMALQVGNGISLNSILESTTILQSQLNTLKPTFDNTKDSGYKDTVKLFAHNYIDALKYICKRRRTAFKGFTESACVWTFLGKATHFMTIYDRNLTEDTRKRLELFATTIITNLRSVYAQNYPQ